MVIGVLMLLAGVALLALWVESDKGTDAGRPAFGTLMVIIGLAVGVLGANSKSSKQESLQRAKVEELGFDLRLHVHPLDLKVWREEFDCNSSSELKTLQAEREALIAKVLKRDGATTVVNPKRGEA